MKKEYYVNMLLVRSIEIQNKINNTITEILRDKSDYKDCVERLMESIVYTCEDCVNMIHRK